MKKKFFIQSIFILIISIFLSLSKISLPNAIDMVDFQFNMFTISSVLAGFSFTTLGILLGMSSETLMDKLKNTTIITDKSEKIVMSLLEFCFSGLISLLFVIGIMDLLYVKPARKILFFYGELSLLVGLIYFLISVYEIYGLIKTIYGVNVKKAEDKRKKFLADLDEAKKRNAEYSDIQTDNEDTWKM